MTIERTPGGPREWPISAGEVLAEALSERGWTQAELARRTDRPVKTINEIVNAKAAVTPETALQLEVVLGIPAHIWLNLERNFSEWRARQKERARLRDKSAWIRRFPLRDLKKYGVIKSTRSEIETTEELLRFFAVANESAWRKQWMATAVALRKARSFRPDTESLAAWLRWGEIEATSVECKSFNAETLEGHLPEIRSLSTLEPFAFADRLTNLLAESGVALVLLPELAGTHISGAARWLSPVKALVQLSLRHKRDDQFWFTLCHEIGHLLHGSRRTTYVDIQIESSDAEGDEVAADNFASDTLVPQADYERFVQSKDLTPKSIQMFASSIGVSPGVVLGRLQNDRLVPPSRWNFLKRTVEFAG